MSTSRNAFEWDWHYVGQSLPFCRGRGDHRGGLHRGHRANGAGVASGRCRPNVTVCDHQSCPAKFYVDFFRSTPFLIQLVWLFFALPMLVDVSLTGLEAAIIGLGLYIGSYQAEVIRGGILSVDPGTKRGRPRPRHDVGAALPTNYPTPGHSAYDSPASMNVLVVLIKESHVVSAVSVTDLMWRAQAVGTRSYRPLEPLTFAGIVYVLIIMPLSLWSRRVHRLQTERLE